MEGISLKLLSTHIVKPFQMQHTKENRKMDMPLEEQSTFEEWAPLDPTMLACQVCITW